MHLARLLTFLAAAALAAAPAAAQTIKSLGYNTTNGTLVYTGTNDFRLPATIKIGTNQAGISSGGQFLSLNDGGGGVSMQLGTNAITVYNKISFGGAAGTASSNAAATRSNLGATTVGDAVFTATNAAAGATALELGATNDVSFNSVAVTNAATTRTNLGIPLSALTNTSNVTFLSAVGAAQTIFSVRTNDLSITNETNATSTGLSFDTEPNARYVVTLYPIFEGSTALQVINTNASVFGNWNTTGTGFSSTNPLTNEISTGASAVIRAPLQIFYVEGGTNAGSISMTFRSSTATNTNTIKAGSFLHANRMP
jgi:hypothetical protein